MDSLLFLRTLETATTDGIYARSLLKWLNLLFSLVNKGIVIPVIFNISLENVTDNDNLSEPSWRQQVFIK